MSYKGGAVGLIVRGVKHGDWPEVNRKQCVAMKALLFDDVNKWDFWRTTCPVRTCRGTKNHVCYTARDERVGSLITSMRLVPHWERFYLYDPLRFPTRKALRAALVMAKLQGTL